MKEVEWISGVVLLLTLQERTDGQGILSAARGKPGGVLSLAQLLDGGDVWA